MLELIIIVLFCWLLFTVFKLMFKLAWGATKVIALLLSFFAIPILIGCLLLAGGVILLLPVAMLVVAALIINN